MTSRPAWGSAAWQKFITLRSVKTNQASAPVLRPGYGPSPTPRANRRRAHISTARASILGVLMDQPEPCTVRALSALTRQHPNTIREHLDGLVDDRLAVRTRAPVEGRGRPAWLYSAAPEVGSEPGGGEYAGLASALAAQIARTTTEPRTESIEAGRAWGRDLIQRSRAASRAGADVEDADIEDADATDPDVAGAEVVAEGESLGPAADEAPLSGVTNAAAAVSVRREVVALLDRLGFAPSPDARVSVVKLRRCPLLEAAHKNPEVVCGVHLGVVRGALEELGADPEQTELTSLEPFSEPGACRLDLLPRRSTAR